MVHRASRAAAAAFAALLSACLLVAAAAGQNDARTVRVGVFQLHPIVFQDDEGRARGLYVDLCDRIAAEAGWRVEYVGGTWADGLQRLRNGEIDLMTVVIATPEREAYLDFAHENVMTVWGQAFARTGTAVQNILDLDGARVAIMRDDQNGHNFVANAERFGVACDIVEVGTHHEVFQLVQRGTVAAGVAPNIFGYAHAREYDLVQTPIVFDPNPTTFAAPAGRNTDLLATIDRKLRTWQAEEGSYYYEALNRWFGQTAGPPPLPVWLGPAAAGSLLLAVLLVAWNRSLERKVRDRTRKVAEGERMLRAIFDQTFQFLGVLDPAGRLRDVNRTALAFAGIDHEDVIGREFWECPWWSHDPALQDELKTAVRSAAQGHVHFGRATHLDADGHPHLIEYTIKPIVDDDGRVVMLIPEGHDVTEKEQLERNLRQSQKMEAIGTLAGGIAHDFNNILTAISGFNELALHDAADRPEILASLQEVSRATDRARSLVQQILTFSRRREAAQTVFAPRPVVSEAVKLLRSSLPSTIVIDEELDADCSVLADPTQIHQIVLNLGTNAFHAMEDTGGRLGVSLGPVDVAEAQGVQGATMPPGRYVRLAVSDSGVGMPRSMLDKIFEPFFTSKAAGKGTGLGLSVVHGIVKSSRGYVRVLSEPGAGTTFEIFFPPAFTDHGAPAPAPAEPNDPRGRERVLFVDDETPLVELAERYLAALGYRVTACGDGLAAQALLENDPDAFDIVVTDHTMPGLSGLQLVRALRERCADMPVILCTGQETDLDEGTLRELDIDRVIHKPTLMRSLAGAMRNALDERLVAVR